MMALMTILVGSCLVALALLIWFRTDAWLEYTRLFHLNFLSGYKEYDARQKEDLTLTYLNFLRLHHYGFITRLLTCPTCIGVWVGAGAALAVYLLGAYTFILALGLFPIFVIFGLILFLTIDKLLG